MYVRRRMLLSRCALYVSRVLSSLCHVRLFGRVRSSPYSLSWEGCSVPVRSSTDVVVTLRIVRFSCALVVMSRAFVRSRSFVAVFPVLGRLLVSVRSSTDVVVTLRIVRLSFVVMPRAYDRSSSFAHSVCMFRVRDL